MKLYHFWRLLMRTQFLKIDADKNNQMTIFFYWRPLEIGNFLGQLALRRGSGSRSHESVTFTHTSFTLLLKHKITAFWSFSIFLLFQSPRMNTPDSWEGVYISIPFRKKSWSQSRFWWFGVMAGHLHWGSPWVTKVTWVTLDSDHIDTSLNPGWKQAPFFIILAW